MVMASNAQELLAAMDTARRTEQLVVVDFFAPWCIGCKTLYPKLRQIAERNQDVSFIKVNCEVEELRQFAADCGIDKLPFFHLYRSGELVARFSANISTVSVIRAEIASHKECTGPGCSM